MVLSIEEAGSGVEQQRTPDYTDEQYEEAIRDLPGDLDQQVRSTARIEQGYLRRRLFGTRATATCALCGCELLGNALDVDEQR